MKEDSNPVEPSEAKKSVKIINSNPAGSKQIESGNATRIIAQDGSTLKIPLPATAKHSLPSNLNWQEVQQGRKPGDRYIRLSNPVSAKAASSSQPAHLQLTEQQARSRGSWSDLKRLLLGMPIATSRAAHERLSKLQALAILSSDALSSIAYGTELILFQLVLAQRASRPEQYILPISAVIAILIVIVATSYRQTLFAYPNGGGSYVVAKENLGVNMGLIAGAALLIDYILNVAVAISAGVAQLVSAVPAFYDYEVWIAVGLVVFMTVVNLRGIRESGLLFSVPVYIFIFSFLGMLVFGLGLFITGNIHPRPISEATTNIPGYATQVLSFWLITQSFAAGCTALTGVEAIANGVPAFRPPESKNAATTLVWMSIILTSFFVGTSFLADRLDILPREDVTVIAQMAMAIFGDGSPLFFLVTFATMLILVLAANTSYADFPRLASLLARDKFLPNLFSHRGDRLAFSTGIIALGGAACLLIITFNGKTEALAPLFAIGAFMAFTLNQAGMVVHWLRNPGPGARRSMLINGFGAVATGLTLIVLAVAKFTEGAYLVIFLIPLFFLGFKLIYRHYRNFARQISLPEQVCSIEQAIGPQESIGLGNPNIVVPVADLNKITLSAITFAKSLGHQVKAVHINDDLAAIKRLEEKWQAWEPGVPLEIVESPYRSVASPLLVYIAELQRRNPGVTTTVVLPEFVTRHWWEQLLHNQTAFRLKAALLFLPGVVVVSVPYHLSHESSTTD